MGIPFASAIELKQLSTPSNPPAGSNLLYTKSNGKVYTKSSAGVETLVPSADVQTSAPSSPANGQIWYDTDDPDIGSGSTGGGPWIAYTPTWSGLTLSNGALDCAYEQRGKTVTFRMLLLFGSSSSMSGTQLPTLPVAAKTGTYPTFFGSALDASAGGGWRIMTWMQSTTTIALLVANTTSDNYDRTLNATVPFTWATGDIITITGTYEGV